MVMRDLKKRKSMSFIPACQSSTDMKERSEIALCNVCPLCLYLFISFHLSANIWASLQDWVCARVCLHVVTHHFLQDFVTIFQLTCRSGAWSLVPAFQDDKVYLSVFWYAQRKLGLTAGGGRKRGATTSSPPPRTTQNVILPLAAACAQPSCWKEQTFKTLWHVSQALPLSQCHWWSWNWQAPSHRSWLGDTPSLVCVTSYPCQGCIPSCHTTTNCIMGWAESDGAGRHMLNVRLCACQG